MLHRHTLTSRLKVCHIRSHQRLRGFGYFLIELSRVNRHDYFALFPNLRGRSGVPTGVHTRWVTGVTAVQGEEG